MDGVEEITLEECQANRATALAIVGMTLAEYRESIDGRCHPKCWRPDGVNGPAWDAVDLWEMFLGEGRHNPTPTLDNEWNPTCTTRVLP